MVTDAKQLAEIRACDARGQYLSHVQVEWLLARVEELTERLHEAAQFAGRRTAETMKAEARVLELEVALRRLLDDVSDGSGAPFAGPSEFSVTEAIRLLGSRSGSS